jgi:hypothetical protein
MSFLKRYALLTILALCGVSFTAQRSHAALVYSVGVSAPSSVGLGQNFVATVYLEEVVSGGDVTVLGNPITGGLISGNFAINRTAGSTVDITGATGNPAFDTITSENFTAADASVTQIDLDPGDGTPVGTLVGANTYRLTLGTISMTATALGDTTFTLADFDPDPNVVDLILGDGTELDGANGVGVTFGNGTITVTGVPEPTTMGALGVFGAVGAAVSCYRRRKQRATSANLPA